MLIDLEDVEKCKVYNWGVSKVHDKRRKISRDVFYVQHNDIMLHRYLLTAQKGQFVDHINHNELDNRKINLRICTKNQNAMNILLPVTNKSGHKGVYWDHHLLHPKWKAFMKLNQKYLHLGYFDTYEEAVTARESAEIKYFGEFRSNDTINDLIENDI